MKKILLFLSVLCLTLTAKAQEETIEQDTSFPYGKMLKMTEAELTEANFKYNDDKNQWVLRKLNGLNQASAALSLLGGRADNYVPHVNDYQVIIQRGITGVSYIEVTFYDAEIYHKILTFANDRGSDLLESKTSKTSKLQFNYDGFSFSLTSAFTSQGAVVSGNRTLSTKDESYDAYAFTIYTDIESASLWLEREAKKQEKRDATGKKKQSAAELM